MYLQSRPASDGFSYLLSDIAGITPRICVSLSEYRPWVEQLFARIPICGLEQPIVELCFECAAVWVP